MAGADGAPAGPPAGLMPLPDLAPSTSRAMMRPCGPEPWMRDTSMPASFASRRANGEANTRSPDGDACGAGAWSFGAAGADAATGAGFGASVLGASVFGGAVGVCGFGAGAALPAPAAAAFTSSPSPAKTAITWLTGTSAVPSATTILAMVPSSTASTSMVALSVSISAMTSPDFTVSPSFLSHLARLPFSIVGDSAGINTSIGIDASPVGGLAGDPREIGRHRCRGSGDHQTGEKSNERLVYGSNVRRRHAPESAERERPGHHGSNTGGRCEPRMPGLGSKGPQRPRVEPAARNPACERAGEREKGHNRCEECHVLPGVHIGPKLRRMGL